MTANRRKFDIMVNDVVELTFKKRIFEKQNGCHDEKWLEESTPKLSKQIVDEKLQIYVCHECKTR